MKSHLDLIQINATQKTTSRRDVGGLDHPSGSLRADTQRDSNSFAGVPLGQPTLAVVRGSPFIQREHKPVQPLDSGFDHREFAVYILLSVFGISVGVLLAAATAFLDWSY